MLDVLGRNFLDPLVVQILHNVKFLKRNFFFELILLNLTLGHLRILLENFQILSEPEELGHTAFLL